MDMQGWLPRPAIVTQAAPVTITSLRIENGRKLHSNLLRRDWSEERQDIPPRLHQHSYFEMVYVLSGEMTQHLENGVFHYQAGDALLLNRNIRHYEGNETDCDILFLCLHPGFLQDLLTQNPLHPGQPQHPAGEITRFLAENEQPNAEAVREYLDFACSLEQRSRPERETERLLDQLRSTMIAQDSGYAYQVQADLLRLFALLGSPQAYHLSRIRMDAGEEAFVYARVLRYLEERGGRASRRELGAILHYHGDYLNRLVKRQCGKTILQLGQEIRVQQAAQLLRETELPVSAIVEQLGMTNRTHFYQLFEQQLGCTPTAYRQR